MMINRLLPQPLSKKVLLVVLIHALVFVFSYWIAFGLRFDFVIPAAELRAFWLRMPGFVLIKLAIFYCVGHCHRNWRHAPLADALALFSAAIVAMLILAALQFLLIESSRIPVTVLLADFGVTLLALEV